MNSEGEQVLMSILEESPIYSTLTKEERRIVLENIKRIYSDFFGMKHENKETDNADDWFKKRL